MTLKQHETKILIFKDFLTKKMLICGFLFCSCRNHLADNSQGALEDFSSLTSEKPQFGGSYSSTTSMALMAK